MKERLQKIGSEVGQRLFCLWIGYMIGLGLTGFGWGGVGGALLVGALLALDFFPEQKMPF